MRAPCSASPDYPCLWAADFHTNDVDRHARGDDAHADALRELLDGIGRLGVAMEMPSDSGLHDVVAECATRVIRVNTSPVLCHVLTECVGHGLPNCLQPEDEEIDLPSKSVDLVFCQGLVGYLESTQCQVLVLTELARISRRYVVLYEARPRFSATWTDVVARAGLEILKRSRITDGSRPAELVLLQSARKD